MSVHVEHRRPCFHDGHRSGVDRDDVIALMGVVDGDGPASSAKFVGRCGAARPGSDDDNVEMDILNWTVGDRGWADKQRGCSAVGMPLYHHAWGRFYLTRASPRNTIDRCNAVSTIAGQTERTTIRRSLTMTNGNNSSRVAGNRLEQRTVVNKSKGWVLLCHDTTTVCG